MSESTTYVAVVKDECETCHLAVPVLAEIYQAGHPLTICWQDDGGLLSPVLAAAVDDRALERSFHPGVETAHWTYGVFGDRSIHQTRPLRLWSADCRAAELQIR